MLNTTQQLDITATACIPNISVLCKYSACYSELRLACFDLVRGATILIKLSEMQSHKGCKSSCTKNGTCIQNTE